MQPPRGPTFVSVPVDDWDRECLPLAAREVSRHISGDPSLLARAGAALSEARQPVIVVGASVARDDAWHETIALAERHRAAVWVSPMSARNSFPERHPLFAGFLPADRKAIVARLQGADFILALGAPVIHLPRRRSRAAHSGRGNARPTDRRSGGGGVVPGGRLHRHEPEARCCRAARSWPVRRTSRRSGLTDRYPAAADRRASAAAQHTSSKRRPSSRGPMHDYLPILERDTFHTCASGGLGFGLPAAVRRRPCAARPQGHRAAGRWLGNVFHPGALERRRTSPARDLHRRQQLELPRARGIRPALRYRRAAPVCGCRTSTSVRSLKDRVCRACASSAARISTAR